MECGARLLVDLDLTPVSELAEDVTPPLFNPCLNVVLHMCYPVSLDTIVCTEYSQTSPVPSQ